MLKSNLKTLFKVAFFGLLFLFIMVQLFPYGRNHTNPPFVNEPAWDTPQTRATFYRACADCHSNETKWPWYSHVAPVSWQVQKHVEEGRSKLNVSEWGTKNFHGDEAAEEVQEGAMPIKGYPFLHPESNLTPEEKERFIQGLKATFAKEENEEGAQEKGEKE